MEVVWWLGLWTGCHAVSSSEILPRQIGCLKFQFLARKVKGGWLVVGHIC